LSTDKVAFQGFDKVMQPGRVGAAIPFADRFRQLERGLDLVGMIPLTRLSQLASKTRDF